MDADLFETEIQKCDWLFDLFAIGYDYIATRVTPADLDANYPRLASDIGRLAAMHAANLLVAADGGVPPQIVEFLRPATSWSGVSILDLEGKPFLTRLLLFLLTGERDKEVRYTSWPDIDYSRSCVRVTAKKQLG